MDTFKTKRKEDLGFFFKLKCLLVYEKEAHKRKKENRSRFKRKNLINICRKMLYHNIAFSQWQGLNKH